MPRAVVLTLLVTWFLAGSLEAQRAAGAFGGHAAGSAVRSGFVGHHSVANGFVPTRGSFPSRFRLRRSDFGGFRAPFFFSGYGPFYPDYGPFWYEQPYADIPNADIPNGPAPAVIIQRPDDSQPWATETRPAMQIIEVPGAANSTAAERLPPAIFILANGERVESRRFVLTASKLSISVERRERTIPLDVLDLNATITANRERGIDLRIPADRNEISLSF